MKTSGVNDISPPITYLPKFCFLCYGRKCCWPIILQDSLKCNTSRKKWMMKCIFGMQRNFKIFYKLILPFWVCVSRHSQSTQNKKFAYLYNISRKTCGWSGSSAADKYERFLQVNRILDLCNQDCPKYPK